VSRVFSINKGRLSCSVMGDPQCSLCLSCGVPFMPDMDELDYYNRQGTLSLLFLNTAYKTNMEIRRMFKTPRFVSTRHEAHVFHTSHVAPALTYMCDRHRDDGNVGPAANPANNTLVNDAPNEPFLYYRAPGSKEDKQAELAIWARPSRRKRINMKPLLRAIQTASAKPTARAIEQNLEQTYTTCDGCNFIMTQLADTRFILGYKTAGRKNTRGRVIEDTPVKQFKANPGGYPLSNAYGHWRVANHPPIVADRPRRNDSDSDDPFVAYYLHQCLPYRSQGRQHDIFHDLAQAMRRPARTLYLEQCWLILEIACLAILLEEGRITEANRKRSHGMHQHLGALDFYVSFFLWRLMEFEYGRQLQGNMDFVQWHQKYYWEALNCKGLFRRNRGADILGRLIYGSTQQSSKDLIEQICKNLLILYNGKLRNLIRLVTGNVNVPAPVKDFFVPVGTLRTLRMKANMVCFIHLCLSHFSVD
jgi:hypothetical protein